MLDTRDNAGAPGCSRQAFIGGLIGMALGEAILVILVLIPGSTGNDIYMTPYYLSMFLILLFSLPVLISLFFLKVQWFLACGAFLLPFLAAYMQGRLFPTADDPIYGSLIYGGGVIVLSLILVVLKAVGKGKSPKTPEEKS